MHSLPGMMEAIDKTRPGGNGASAARYLRTPRGITPRGNTPRVTPSEGRVPISGDDENRTGENLCIDAGLGRTMVAKEAGCELAHNILEKAILGVRN